MGGVVQNKTLIFLISFLFSCQTGNFVKMDFRHEENRKWHLDRTFDAMDDQARCQFGPGWANLMGGCYLITQKGVAWDMAAKACQSLDSQAEFGTLWTTADMNFVSHLARSKDLQNIYVNGRYEPQFSDFRWHLKRPLIPEYTPWGPGEPKRKTIGQAIVLHAPVKQTDPGYLTVSPPATLLPVLCKRPAKGFRRKTPEEIEQFTSRISHGSNGWSLAKKATPGEAKSTEKRTGMSDRTSGFAASPAAASVLGLSNSNASVETRNLPPPISKNRKFLSKIGHFEPVLPMAKNKDSKRLEVSAIEPVDVVDIVKVREEKLNEIFGRSTLRLKDAMAFYPEQYRYPTTDYQRMAHVLTTELVAQDQRERKTDAPFEKAKILSMKLFAKGKAIQCFFGDKEDSIANRQVECIATAGVIDACVKQVLLSGKIIRGCGLPGTDRATKKAGCVKTTNGEICYCNLDNCNAALRNQRASFLFVFFFLGILKFCRKICSY